jgi:hypothetical protein
MKAFSLWQPWASLWLSPRKPHETRHWSTIYRGKLAVHAAQHFERNFPAGDPLREILEDEFGSHWGRDLPKGCILGWVDLVSVRSMTETQPVDDDDRACGNWSSERFAWRRGAYSILNTPVPFRGRQGLFNVPDELLAGAATTVRG